jgi:aryl-alcohol dehydrogenase-like predicted oxidoreductase
LRQLHRDFDPVLRLGFLTDSRERTLAQASLQFLFHWPWVASVLVPLPSPERLEEFLAASSRPPLTDEEVDRALATLGPASGVSRELI